MSDLTVSVINLLAATMGGAAVGVERQWSGHASGAHPRLGGIRTFTLLGGASGLAGILAGYGYLSLGLVIAAGAVGVIVVGYAAASRHDVDATTEVAALVVVAAGLLAGLGSTQLASGIVSVAVLLLVEKTRLHAMVHRIDDEELRAAARFAVMAVVILPLLPEGPFGPLGGIRPRELWLLVLFFTGLSFAGYIARRLTGPAHGYTVAGILGGLVSSTSVTWTFSRLSRREPDISVPLAVGTIGACTVLYLRVMLATAVLNADVAVLLLPRLAVPCAIGGIWCAVGLVRARQTQSEAAGTRNPLQMIPALQMAATFQAVLFGMALVRTRFGATGLLTAGALLGITDVDALTISMSKSASAGTAAALAANAIVIGIAANCALKLALALGLGTRAFRLASAPALAAMMAALLLSL